jgi:hypothetical protein
MILSSLFSFLFLVVFLILSHDSHDPSMLPGARPELPAPKELAPVPPRLGHRVGSKLGRKLSAVLELDSDDEDDDDEEEGQEEDVFGERAAISQVREMTLTRTPSMPQIQEEQTD